MPNNPFPAAIALLLFALVAPLALANDNLDLDVDFDGDGIINRFDNCHVQSNPSQFDADEDGYGNPCDGDLDNDGDVDFEDLSVFSGVIFTSDMAADFNEDGVVNFLDLRIFRGMFANGIPGPPLVMRWVGGTGSWNEAVNWFPARVPSAFFFEHAIINTAENELVTVEEDSIISTRTLELNGSLRICGEYQTYLDVTATGSITVDGACGLGSFAAFEGINLEGTVDLIDGTFTAPFIIGDSTSKVQVAGMSELGSFFAEQFEVGVDITVAPGALLRIQQSQNTEAILDNITVSLNSAPELPARLEFVGTLTGSGSLQFNGPANKSAIGQFYTLNAMELGPGINVDIAPGAYGSFDGQITSSGTIEVAEEATLFFGGFSLFYNSGSINCQSNGGLRVFPSSNPFPSDNILFNNETGVLQVDNCAMSWPTRVLNDGSYTVTNSDIDMPLLDANGVPVSITDSDITVKAFQPPVASEFYVFDPANNNTVQVNGLFDLRDQSLEIDAAKWRFEKNSPTGPASFQFGTLISNTPLKINTDASLFLLFVDLQTGITLEPASVMTVNAAVSIQEPIQFLEPDNCQSTAAAPATIRLEGPPDDSSNTTISATSPDTTGCLSAEIVSAFQVSLPQSVDVVAANARLKVFGEGQGSIDIKGTTSVSGGSGELVLNQVTQSGALSCTEGARLVASGSSAQPFENNGSLIANGCDVLLQDSWTNVGTIDTTMGSLSLSGTADTPFTPGTGTISANFTNVDLNQTIDDLSTLSVFTVNGGTFTVAAGITDSNPLIDLDLFPNTVQFSTGFELVDKTVTGTQPLTLVGTTTLQNVTLTTDTDVLDGAVVTVLDQLTLDDSLFTIQSGSPDGQASVTQVAMNGAMNIGGTGTVSFAAHGQNARSELIQTVADMPVSIGAGIGLINSSDGAGVIRAGDNAGTLSVFGPITVAGEQARLQLESATTLYGKTTALDQGQLRVIDSALTFTGPDAALDIEVRAGPSTGPGVVGLGASVIDISQAAVSLIPGPGYSLESDKVVTVLEHAGDAARVGEFADISGASIDAEPFTPDYASPDVTLLRGPSF